MARVGSIWAFGICLRLYSSLSKTTPKYKTEFFHAILLQLTQRWILIATRCTWVSIQSKEQRWLWNEADTSEMIFSEWLRAMSSAERTFKTFGWLLMTPDNKFKSKENGSNAAAISRVPKNSLSTLIWKERPVRLIGYPSCENRDEGFGLFLQLIPHSGWRPAEYLGKRQPCDASDSCCPQYVEVDDAAVLPPEAVLRELNNLTYIFFID